MRIGLRILKTNSQTPSKFPASITITRAGREQAITLRIESVKYFFAPLRLCVKKLVSRKDAKAQRKRRLFQPRIFLPGWFC